MHEELPFSDVSSPTEPPTMLAKAPATPTETPPAVPPAPGQASFVLDRPRPVFPEPQVDLSTLNVFPQPAPAEKSDTWTLQRLDCLFGLNRGPVELSIKIALPYELAEPLVNEGNRRTEDIRQRVAVRLAASPEHGTYRTAARRLQGLEEERDRLDEILAGVEPVLVGGSMTAGQLVELSAHEVEAKTQRDMVQRALVHAQRSRDAAARAVHQVAGMIAAEERDAALAAVAKAEREAAGLFRVAQDQLAELVVTSAMGGAIRNPWWSQHAAEPVATELCGPCPPMPAPPPPEKPANPLAWLSSQPNAPPAVVGGMPR